MAAKLQGLVRSPKTPNSPLAETSRPSRGGEITAIGDKDLEIISPIGSGSFGQVFSARWKKRGLVVAVKFVNADRK